jgi:serine/threonine protein kinase
MPARPAWLAQNAARGFRWGGGNPPDELDLHVEETERTANRRQRVNHARGLVHRDLKPSNIILTTQVFPCFIDR